jgi:tetratricopeptide (TPR) repeat protein
MYNLLIALGAGTLVTVLFGYLFGAPRIAVGYGLIPGFVALIGVYIVLARRVGKIVTELMNRVQNELQPKGVTKPAAAAARIPRAIEILKEGNRFRRRQFLLGGQLDAQVGMLLYLDKKFDEAEPYLEKASVRNWVARAMLAVLHYRRKSFDKMKTLFESNVKINKKESLLWNLYAWCVWKQGNRDEAINILARASEVLGEDARIESNKLALQKNKKMKMRGWNEMWYQFHLDEPPMPKPQVDHRSVYRGR